ncbi:DUF3265 domain-containing protein [Vibrio parahaemolyticus]|uniref:DUF3265 domain-containing protein n=1 Tax=Vibrio parahaemolyticus TaxID=670 RepID=A0A249WAB0_VIBPH|nr:DUF3265 domain-containing protein [Vibrio parahaemolyticus]AUT88430.1 DUF3265 domain-containing protein [Vibrio parahaemolyticus]EGQ9070109.1 DUF3265 domain-containing protein [Vibrio parahaemolyticus]EGQ9080220.1 DUF3265 domain-containing protein [Vibrio parahaemolyticus]EGQ9085051.1 DUF3265 domain-containing protein [Vibrio parahaemolyticus]
MVEITLHKSTLSGTGNNYPNKRFKTDSQRVAFVVCGKFIDLGGVRKHRIALLTT